jgi:two-component system, sensor histidine kinase RegB
MRERPRAFRTRGLSSARRRGAANGRTRPCKPGCHRLGFGPLVVSTSSPPRVAPRTASARGDVAIEPYRINLSWLVRLRYGAITGQIAVLLVVDRLMGMALPLLPLGVILGLEVATNLACSAWLRRAASVREYHVGALVALDVILFTLLLYFTGGPTNPFSFLYLIHIALAALVLGSRWMWALVALTLACSGALFLRHAPLSFDEPPAAIDHAHMDHAAHLEHMARMERGAHAGHGSDSHDYGMHLRGMWVALAVAASFIVYFLQRATRELAQREAELRRVREHTAQNERLASLATLAAGAAHELATPLSTIAVVARELERRLEQAVDDAASTDARLIREQVERCRGILSQMAADAGEPVGDVVESLSVGELLGTATAGLDQSDRVDVKISTGASDQPIVALPRPLAQALRSLLKNALDATQAPERVELDVTLDRSGWRFAVNDRGPGMTPDVRARAMEPFFTTKPAGQGMGLGLFLTKSVAEQHGGRLEIDSAPGRGTRAWLVLPLDLPATICRIPTEASRAAS